MKFKFLLPFLLVFLITACSDKTTSNIELVKNGYLDDYKTTTVGQALDNWKYCQENRLWEYFTTDNGINVVEFSCEVPVRSKYVTSSSFTAQFTINNDDTFQISYMAIENILKSDGLSHKNTYYGVSELLHKIYNNSMVP